MMPEPWNPDDLSDEEYAAWEAEREAEWLASPDREFWEELRDMVADGLVIPGWWEDDHPAWIARALWRRDHGYQPDPRDLEALTKAAKAYLAGETPKRPRGRQAVAVTPRLTRKRQLKARYLLDQGVAKKVIAGQLPGVNENKLDALAEAGGRRQFGFDAADHLDAELMEEIIRECRGEEKRAAMMGSPIKKGGR